jgi:hypothetical protein
LNKDKILVEKEDKRKVNIIALFAFLQVRFLKGEGIGERKSVEVTNSNGCSVALQDGLSDLIPFAPFNSFDFQSVLLLLGSIILP